jgi:hypothetical protein
MLGLAAGTYNRVNMLIAEARRMACAWSIVSVCDQARSTLVRRKTLSRALRITHPATRAEQPTSIHRFRFCDSRLLPCFPKLGSQFSGGGGVAKPPVATCNHGFLAAAPKLGPITQWLGGDPPAL